MLAEEREMRANYEHYFLRKYRYLYWLVVVDNHFEDIYSFFLYTRKQRTKLTRSYELVHFARDPVLYKEMLAALRRMSKLRIEMRDTRYLIHPGTDITHDTVHGHHG
ncbi:hypothetical protein [Lacticaseibacillus zhaodongensis]|uniref:hypothetical protein n=1 Tax=Lacticaseibacillus zhaodongensis TaxID=2668065 RepID=UPI0012D2E538|nr:hypothetical protein [Lacticaseibacillus zhaodongensis]